MTTQLFITKIYEEAEEKYKEAFDKTREPRRLASLAGKLEPEEGYFEDAAGPASVMRSWGTTWAAVLKDFRGVIKIQNEDGAITVTLTKKEVMRLVQRLDPHAAYPGQGRTEGASSERLEIIRRWHVYYERQRKRLLRFLKRAVREKSSLEISVVE